MVKKFRINNDIEVNWTVNLKKPDGSLVDLTTIPLGVKLVIGTKEYPITVANSGLVIYGNLISFTFYGYRQEYTGAYIIKLFDTNSDSVTYDVCNAFILVDHSWQSADVLSYPGIVDADSSIDVNRVLTIYSQIVPATSEALGGIRLGYEQSGDNYPVQTDANGRAYVNVPGGGGGGGSAVSWGEGGDDYVWLNVNGVEKSLLTAHQSLSGYATKTWVGDQGFLTNINSSMITTALGYTPADSDDLSNYLALSGGTMENTDLVQNLNADLLDGLDGSAYQSASYSTIRDFEYGTLITTDIDYSNFEGDPFYLEIKGDTYTREHSCFTQVQGYIYDNTVINYGVTHLGFHSVSGIVCMNVDGHLCFWFPRQGYWESYSIAVYSSRDYRTNRVTEVTDAEKPVGTKEVALDANTVSSVFKDGGGNVSIEGNFIAGGSIGIGVQSPSNKLDVDGVIHATTGIYTEGYGAFGGVGSSSDARLKDGIEDVYSDRALSVLMQLKPKEWTWNEKNGYFSGRKGAGLVAQDVEEILPFAVIDEDEYKSLTYSVFHAYEIAGLQNHEARIAELEKKIEAYATR